MNETLDFLIRHGYTVVFLWVLAEQVGLPLPAIPFLLAAGALAGAGNLSPGIILALAVAASLLADLLWYGLGRSKGSAVVRLICRISLEPDSCVRRTEDMFARHGAASLLVAKFIPGFNTVAPPLAGVFRMKPSRFLLYDSAGAALWVGTFVGAGWLLSDQVERALEVASELGTGLLAFLAALGAGWIGFKIVQRRRFLRQIEIDRITPESLKEMLERGERPTVVDLRHSVDFEAEPRTIPGATYLPLEEIDLRHGELPRNREVVLYCT